MTKDEDDWLSDFLEVAQATARQSQVAAEKEYMTKLKLFAPRLERARACEAKAELEQRLSEAEALAGQKKFAAASDKLDEAWLTAASVHSAAALTATAATGAEPVEESAPEPAAEPAARDVAAVEAMPPSGEMAFEERPVSTEPTSGELISEASPVVEGEPMDESAAEVEEPIPPAESPAENLPDSGRLTAEIPSDTADTATGGPAELMPADEVTPAEGLPVEENDDHESAGIEAIGAENLAVETSPEKAEGESAPAVETAISLDEPAAAEIALAEFDLHLDDLIGAPDATSAEDASAEPSEEEPLK